jgi:hypothetical protein
MGTKTDDGLELFRLQRCTAGYVWRRADLRAADDLDLGTDRIESLTLIPLNDELESYLLPDDLFLRLTEVEPTPAGVLAFANAYGPLGAADSFDTWQFVIGQLRAAVSLYGALRGHAAGDSGGLQRLIRWDDAGVYFIEPGQIPLPIATTDINADRLSRFGRGDLAGPARYLLQESINHGLHAVSARLLWNTERTHLALRVVSTSLEGCVWLQLARLIDCARSYRQCRTCRKWMLIDRESAGNRPSRFTCSNACRMRLYLARIGQARRLHAQHVPLAEIARRVSAKDAKTVKGWLRGE